MDSSVDDISKFKTIVCSGNSQIGTQNNMRFSAFAIFILPDDKLIFCSVHHSRDDHARSVTFQDDIHIDLGIPGIRILDAFGVYLLNSSFEEADDIRRVVVESLRSPAFGTSVGIHSSSTGCCEVNAFYEDSDNAPRLLGD
jgi:hypothetical protein